MGFTDERRNATVLKGHGGNLDKAVESLIRLGESSRPPVRTESPAPSREQAVNGISIQKTRPAANPATQTNPFERLDQEQAQQQRPPPQQNAPPAVNGGSYYSQPVSPTNPYNPWNMHQQPLPSTGLEQSFQNMNMSATQQQLFPNNTGGFAAPGLQQQNNPFLKTFTPPPVPQIPQHYDQISSQQSPWMAQQQYPQQQPGSPQGNPFLRNTRSQVFTSSNPFGQQQQQQQQQQPQSQNPFLQQQQTGYQPQQPQFPAQQPQQQFSSPSNTFQQQQPSFQQQQQQQPMGVPTTSPFSQQPQSQSSPFQSSPFAQQPQPQYQQSPQPQQPQQQYFSSQTPQAQPQPAPFAPQRSFTSSFDKSSILALYSAQPQARPATIVEHEPLNPAFPGPNAQGYQQNQQVPMNGAPADFGGPKRAVTMPVGLPGVGMGASNNPFAAPTNGGPAGMMGAGAGAGGAAGAGAGTRHVSNESVDFAGLGGGRHSPDAFAGLSARSGR
jgi:hypothetical protein